MKDRLMIGLLGIMVLIVSISGCANQISVNNTNNTQVTQPTHQSTQNNTKQTNISPSEAKAIAKRSIAEPGAMAGEPKLVNTDGTLIYVVPVVQNGKNVGEIDVDAQTGKVVGGAGGAPP